MAKTRAEKEKILEEYTEAVRNCKAIIFSNYSSVKSKDLFELRRRLEEKGIKFKIAKNTLLKLALKNQKIDLPEEIYSHPLAVSFASDEIEPSKIIWSFSRENENLKILGGVVDKEFIGPEKVFSLALLPSSEELYQRLVGLIKGLPLRLIFALKYQPMKLIHILKEIQNK